MQESDKKTPRHVSIIMDGNGRWAKRQGLERVQGHLKGVESVRTVLEECSKSGVEYLSLYTFSTENWKRPQAEVSYLMQLMFKSIMNELDNLMNNNVRLVVLGDRASLDRMLDDTISQAEKLTAGNKGITLILFLSYSGKWDILQAAKRMAADAASSGNPEQFLAKADEQLFDSYLVTSGIPAPDLIIRTSGEQRLSNYLLWQGAYSEFYFTDVLWPDFGREELQKALDEYSLRDRRYGKVK